MKKTSRPRNVEGLSSDSEHRYGNQVVETLALTQEKLDHESPEKVGSGSEHEQESSPRMDIKQPCHHASRWTAPEYAQPAHTQSIQL
jgi:hypothetical protein